MTLSKIVFFFCLFFILGIFLNSFFYFSLTALLFLLIITVLLIFVLNKNKKLVLLGFCLLFLAAGIWRQQLAELEIINNELRKYNDLEQEITLTGTVAAEPDVRETNTKLIIKTGNNKILVTTGRYPEYKYGDRLEIKGKLETPIVFESFNYKDYLAKDDIYSVVYFPQIQKIDGGSTSINFYSLILSFKNRLRESIYQNLSPPQSAILGAVILGDKRQISDEWKEKLNITGVRHITAVSGMHIVILAGILMWLGMALGLWRGQAFYLAIIILILFITMIGWPASAVRAGIMGGLLLLAQKLGRMNSAQRTLVLAAALMLLDNPLLLRYDVGFQLSFLATLGIIYLMPFFQEKLKKIPFKFLRDILALTLAAQVFTLPILIYNFGYVSLVSLITNILIVPLLPFIMIFGFITALAGAVWQFLGWIFSLPTWFFLTYVVKIIDFFSQIPLASLTIKNLHWFWLLIAYLILGFFTWQINKPEKQKIKFLKY